MIRVGECLPDLPPFQNPGALVANNVIPESLSYRPFQAFAEQGGALTARCQGAISVRSKAGVIFNFAGDATKLYKYNGSTLVWDDVTRTSGGAYACPSEGMWSFSQYGDDIVAFNGADTPQVFDLGSSSNFAALGGTPPIATTAGVIGNFIMAGNISGASNQVRWPGIGTDNSWTISAATQADKQDFYSGGQVQRIVGGEFGLIIQEFSIKRATYIGSPLIFQFDEISKEHGTPAPGSVASTESLAFFLTWDGFYMIAGAQQLVPIGTQKIDRTFWAEVDQSNLFRMTSAIDPINKLYILSYPGSGSAGGLPNRLAIYNFQAQRWAFGDESLEILFSALSQTGYTLDGLDAISSSLDALPASLDSSIWAGSGRRQLSGFSSAHKWGFFSGAAKEATIDTGEVQITPGGTSKVTKFWPYVTGTMVSLTAQPIERMRQNDPPVVRSTCAQEATGFCSMRSNARYHRFRTKIAAGSVWDHIEGGDVESTPGSPR